MLQKDIINCKAMAEQFNAFLEEYEDILKDEHVYEAMNELSEIAARHAETGRGNAEADCLKKLEQVRDMLDKSMHEHMMMEDESPTLVPQEIQAKQEDMEAAYAKIVNLHDNIMRMLEEC